MNLIKMTVTDSLGRTYILPDLEEGEKLKVEDINFLDGTCAYVYKAVKVPKDAEPSEEQQFVRDPYRFWAVEEPNMGLKAHEVTLVMPLGGVYSGLYRYPKIGEQALVAAQYSGGSAEYYLMGYVPSTSVPFNVTPNDGAESSRRIFEEKGEVLRYGAGEYGESNYSEIGFYQEEKAQWPKTAGGEDFPPIDVLVLDSSGNIRETAWNHHLQKAARIEILAGAPEVLDRKTNAVDEDKTLPIGDFPGDDSALHRGDAHIRAANRVIIKADQEIRLQVGRTVLRIDDTGFNVITRNVAGNYINSYDTSLDMNPRNGINLTGKNINLKAGYRFNAGDGLGGTVATTMGNLNLGGREISIDAYNNTEFKFTVLYQALEYLVNATSGGVALGKEDIKIADYVKFSQDNLEALIKLVRKANQLWAKRKEIVKQKEEEAARLAAKAAAEAEAEKQRQKEEEEKERLEAEKQRREEANLEGNGDNGADTAATGATPESAAQAVVRDPLDTFCDVVRKLVGGKYKFGGQDPENGGLDCSGLIIHALRKMGYDLPDAAVKEMVGGKLDWLTTIPPGNDDSQANQGMLNFYSFEPGRIGHVNVGVGQKQDELTGQIVDATAEGESAMTGRNGGARQLDTAAAGRINQTYPPYSTNSTPVLQGIINFDILEEKYRKEPKE